MEFLIPKPYTRPLQVYKAVHLIKNVCFGCSTKFTENNNVSSVTGNFVLTEKVFYITEQPPLTKPLLTIQR